MSIEIAGPFESYELVVDGWAVPFIDARERDGGRVEFIVDHRLGFTVGAADFEQVARLVANAVAVACGMPSHPKGDLTDAERELYFRHVRHRRLAPQMLTALGSVETEHVHEIVDDPRDDDS